MTTTTRLDINEGLKLLTIDGREVRLTPKQWLLFMYLHDNQNRYVPTEELWRRFWSDEVQRGVVKWLARHLRPAIAPIMLEYRWGIGWRLII